MGDGPAELAIRRRPSVRLIGALAAAGTAVSIATSDRLLLEILAWGGVVGHGVVYATLPALVLTGTRLSWRSIITFRTESVDLSMVTRWKMHGDELLLWYDRAGHVSDRWVHDAVVDLAGVTRSVTTRPSRANKGGARGAAAITRAGRWLGARHPPAHGTTPRAPGLRPQCRAPGRDAPGPAA